MRRFRAEVAEAGPLRRAIIGAAVLAVIVVFVVAGYLINAQLSHAAADRRATDARLATVLSLLDQLLLTDPADPADAAELAELRARLAAVVDELRAEQRGAPTTPGPPEPQGSTATPPAVIRTGPAGPPGPSGRPGTPGTTPSAQPCALRLFSVCVEGNR